MTQTRGTTNGNVRGNNTARRARREWLVRTYRADVDVLVLHDGASHGTYPATPGLVLTASEVETGWRLVPACRCYRCGDLLTADTLTVDRIFPGVLGGLYRTVRRDRAEKVTNIRPACGDCNSKTGGPLATRDHPNRKK